MFNDNAPYDPNHEVACYEKDCQQLLVNFVRLDNQYHVRCADGQWRPVDADTAYAIFELRWTMELSRWRKEGRRHDQPEMIPITYPRVRSWRDRLRIMFGRGLEKG